MSTVEITLRSIQHYMYCSHRWGLLEIERAWAENSFVTKANLMHQRVHDPERNYTSKGKKVYTSVPVYHDAEEYNLYGVVDCLEWIPDKNGISKICIVEYKPTKPKDKEYHEEDLMQVFAQKICVDYVFGCDCDAILYYADVKKRIALPLKSNYEQYDRQLKRILREMRENIEKGVVPPIQKKKQCNGCSMKDLCIPFVKKSADLAAEIRKIQNEDRFV